MTGRGFNFGGQRSPKNDGKLQGTRRPKTLSSPTPRVLGLKV